MPARDEPKIRKVVVPIRYQTASRAAISIIVAQTQNALGLWTVPIITFEGPLGPFLESGRFARDLGVAFIVASHFYDVMMLSVKQSYFGEEIAKPKED